MAFHLTFFNLNIKNIFYKIYARFNQGVCMLRFLSYFITIFVLFIGSAYAFNMPIAGIKIKPVESAAKYSELRCSDDDKAKIREIVETLSKHSYWDLYNNHRSRLEKIGEDVRPVHPLRFLGHIFSYPDLKSCMRAIFNDPIIKYNFMSNFAPRMDVETQKGTLIKYYEDFAKSLNLAPNTVKSYLDNKNWEGLVIFLMNS